MDLKPLVDDPSLDIAAYVDGHVERFREDVRSRVKPVHRRLNGGSATVFRRA